MIVVTGASGGFGLSICERLHKNGFDVLGISRNKKDFALPFRCGDVSSYDDMLKIAKDLRGEKIEALINAAGIASMNFAIATPSRVTQAIINTNLLGTIYCCQVFSPLMIRNGHGSIINFSTIAVPLGIVGEAIYIASKAGVEGFTRVFAKEMSHFNIKVNCIAPGPIATNLLRGVSQDQIDKIIKSQVIQKQYSPDDISNLVELLLDEKSDSMSGQIFRVGGV